MPVYTGVYPFNPRKSIHMTKHSIIEQFVEYVQMVIGVHLAFEGFKVEVTSRWRDSNGWVHVKVGHENLFMMAEFEYCYYHECLFHHGETEDDAFHYSLDNPGACVPGFASEIKAVIKSGVTESVYGADGSSAGE